MRETEGNISYGTMECITLLVTSLIFVVSLIALTNQNSILNNS